MIDSPRAPIPIRVSPALLGLGLAVLAYALSLFWGSNPGYADRFLILIGAAWAAWQLREPFQTAPARPRLFWGSLLVLLGMAGYSLAIFLLQQIGPRTLLLWWLAGAWIITCSGWILAEQGSIRLRLVAFPLLFILFALPIPLRILNPLQDRLQAITTTAAYHGLRLSGMDVEREHFVLSLPSGRLGVEEACSGVRSLTALTALAAFLAYLYQFGPWRGSLLVLATIPIVAVVNIIRVLLSGYIQEAFGPEYITGHWHEALGFAMVFVGLSLILLLASQFKNKTEHPTELIAAPEVQPPASRLVAVLLSIGLIASLALAYLGRSTTEELAAKAPLGEIPRALGPWTGQDLPIPDVVHSLLAPDVALHRRYHNPLGQEANLWAFVWNSGSSIRGYHHPDVCWGNKGFQATDKWLQELETDQSRFAVVAREFRQQFSRQTIFYWTQEGAYVWNEADERAALNDMLTVSSSGHRWVFDLLGWRTVERGPRLTVVLMLPGAGSEVRRDAIDLGNRVSSELHQIAPWTQPGS